MLNQGARVVEVGRIAEPFVLSRVVARPTIYGLFGDGAP
jgi:hypothetical protein